MAATISGIEIGPYNVYEGTTGSDDFWHVNWSIREHKALLGLEGDDIMYASKDYVSTYDWNQSKWVYAPQLSIGGPGNDIYKSWGPWKHANQIIFDADNGVGDTLQRYKEYSDQTEDKVYKIEDRHLLIDIENWGDSWGRGNGHTFLIIDGLNSKGAIETFDFGHVYLSGPNATNDLINIYGQGDYTFEEAISLELFSPQLMGVNSAEEVRSLIESTYNTLGNEFGQYLTGTKYQLDSIRDYDGNLHAGAGDSVKDQYKHQGQADLDGDGTKEDIFTNHSSGRWASVGSDQDFNDYGSGGNTRVVGTYSDPLVLSGEVEAGGPHDSQTRFQNDLWADNLSLGVGGDFDSDGTQEVYWRTNDGGAYLRSLHHADGNIQYANYQNYAQMSDYLTSTGNSNLISTVVG